MTRFGTLRSRLTLTATSTVAALLVATSIVGAALVDRGVVGTSTAVIAVVAATVVGSAVTNWWLIGRALHPVREITREVDEISRSTLHVRVPEPPSSAGDEMRDLVALLNRILDRIESASERQRQFSADASHELRSPLATMRAAAELIEMRADVADAQLAFGIKVEVDRLDQLIDDLIDLSRLESPAGAEHELLDLGLLVREELAADRVTVDAPLGIGVRGDVRTLSRCFRNLVDNAKRHSVDDVVVTVAIHDSSARIEVDDDGPGIPVEHRDRVFERFARLDEGRSRDEGGSGIGLALVMAIVRRHGGEVGVDDSPRLGGARFTVSLPLVERRGGEPR